MIELKKDIDTIKNILINYFEKDVVVYNEETEMIACPSCFINIYENEWVLSPNHSYVNNSFEVESIMNLLLELVSKGIDIKIIPGCFIVLNEYDFEEETNDFEVLDAYDVWEYSDTYSVSEEFAINVLTAKIMENKLKGCLN